MPEMMIVSTAPWVPTGLPCPNCSTGHILETTTGWARARQDEKYGPLTVVAEWPADVPPTVVAIPLLRCTGCGIQAQGMSVRFDLPKP